MPLTKFQSSLIVNNMAEMPSEIRNRRFVTDLWAALQSVMAMYHRRAINELHEMDQGMLNNKWLANQASKTAW